MSTADPSSGSSTKAFKALVIREFIKNLMFLCQQIPSPYDRIRKEFYARKESRRTASSSEHLRFFETADTLFKDLPGAVEFIDDRLQEVLVVFGDSLLSPKEIYSIQVATMAQNMAFPASKKIDYLIRLTNREFWSNSIISDRLGEQELRCCNMFVLLSVERNPLDAENTQDNDGICQSFHPKIRLKIGNRPRSSRVFELNLHAFDGLEAQEIKGFDTLANFHSRIGNSSRIWYQFQHRVHGLKSI